MDLPLWIVRYGMRHALRPLAGLFATGRVGSFAPWRE